MIIMIIFAVFDAFEEAKDMIPTARRIALSDLLCWGKSKKEKKNNKDEDNGKLDIDKV